MEGLILPGEGSRDWVGEWRGWGMVGKAWEEGRERQLELICEATSFLIKKKTLLKYVLVKVISVLILSFHTCSSFTEPE